MPTPSFARRDCEACGADGFAGLNVTHPFKQSVIAHLDELSPEAAAIGAVNTVVFAAGEPVGHNTDCWGFAESFRSAMQDAAARPRPAARRRRRRQGGGAGALRPRRRAYSTIFDIDRGARRRLAASCSSIRPRRRAAVAADLRQPRSRSADGLVNATPVGMAKYPGMPVRPERAAGRDLWVADIVYFPAETELLARRAAAGCRTLAGRGMAVFQAVKAFELITGRQPDPSAMVESLRSTRAASRRVD